jgi:hypothetical protein
MALDDLSDVSTQRDDAATRSRDERPRDDGDLGEAINTMMRYDERLHDDPDVGAQHTLAEVLVNTFAPLDEFEAVNSVLRQLRNRGYEVRPITVDERLAEDVKPAEDDTDTATNGPGGSHYGPGVQPIDLIDALNLGFYEGQVVKYVARWRSKAQYDPDPLIDLRKALWYLERLIAVQRGWRR